MSLKPTIAGVSNNHIAVKEFEKFNGVFNPESSKRIQRRYKLALRAFVNAWELKDKEVDKLSNIITAIEFHGCLTGDCPHDTKNECYMETINIPNLIEDMRNE